MPRPGQQAARRKRARVSTTPIPVTNQEEPGSPNPRARCLPVADLPADFDGIPEDGAQYLAMVMRANEELPWSTRMEGWTPAVEDETKVRPDNGQPTGTRHMALPQGSWEVLFPLHFQNYRKVGGVSRFPHLAQADEVIFTALLLSELSGKLASVATPTISSRISTFARSKSTVRMVHVHQRLSHGAACEASTEGREGQRKGP